MERSFWQKYQNKKTKKFVSKTIEAGSEKANGREPKTCLGRVFNYKLGCFDDMHVLIYVDAHPHL
jgi:hypothetical protein